MKKVFLSALLAAFGALSASAAPILVTVGVGGILNNGIAAPVSSGATSVSFTSLTQSTTACSDNSLCGFSTLLTNSLIFDSGTPAQTFTWNSGSLVYTTSSIWSVTSTGSVGSRTFTILTSGNYTSNISGKDSTAGTLNFTFQEPTNTVGGITFYTYSASGGTVPEPGSMALLGSGLVGLGLIARRRRASK